MHKPNPDEIFKKLDTNGDGVLSKEEFAAGLKKLEEFRHHRPFGPMNPGMPGMPGRMDGDHGPQFGPPHRPMRPSVSQLFERFDKNSDGKLTKDEVPPFVWEHLSKADANKDGAVTKAELEAFHKKQVDRHDQPAK